jgi:hypothetical protein
MREGDHLSGLITMGQKETMAAFVKIVLGGKLAFKPLFRLYIAADGIWVRIVFGQAESWISE